MIFFSKFKMVEASLIGAFVVAALPLKTVSADPPPVLSLGTIGGVFYLNDRDWACEILFRSTYANTEDFSGTWRPSANVEICDAAKNAHILATQVGMFHTWHPGAWGHHFTGILID
ncbi:MAG: hypothetical protein JHC61_08405 [Burkholderiaceae bacterium]|nr:hypothetical protein [Burkholderiaceae bacterium]